MTAEFATAVSDGSRTWTLASYACDLCGSSEHKRILTKRGRLISHAFDIVACRRCAFVFVNPRIVDDEIGRLYDEAYYRGDGFDANVRYEDVQLDLSTERAIRQLVATVAEAVGSLSKLGGVSCLDVGCGSGALVAALAQAGADAIGQDSSSEAQRLAARRGVEFTADSVETLAAGSRRFDVVTAIEVIEHVPHPVAFTRLLAKLLKPGGLLLLGTGNWNVVRWMPKTPYLMPEGHLQYFTPATLGRLLDSAGIHKRSPALNGTWTLCRLASRFGVPFARSPFVRVANAAIRIAAPGAGPHPLGIAGK